MAGARAVADFSPGDFKRAARDSSHFQAPNKANGACFSTNASLNRLQALDTFLLWRAKLKSQTENSLTCHSALIKHWCQSNIATPNSPLHKNIRACSA